MTEIATGVVILILAWMVYVRRRDADLLRLPPGAPPDITIAALFDDEDLATAARALEADHTAKVGALGDQYTDQLRELLREQRRRRGGSGGGDDGSRAMGR